MKTGVLFLLLGLFALSCRHPLFEDEPRPTTVAVADDALASRVQRALYEEHHPDWDRIDIRALQGKITLNGEVFDDEARRRAEVIAREVQGVTSIDNALRIR